MTRTAPLRVPSDLAGPDGAIRGPAGTGRVGAVARADVARVAGLLARLCDVLDAGRPSTPGGRD